MPNERKLDGVHSVLITPFLSNGDVDANGLRRVVDLFLNAGVDGLTALGVTSEAARLTNDERALVLDVILHQVNGRVPVIAGASGDAPRACIELARQAERAGASAVMISPPALGNPTPQAIVSHFLSIAGGTTLPIIVQDYPVVCGYPLAIDVIARLTDEIQSVAAIKLEDAPTPPKVARIRDVVPAHLSILGGLGGAFLFEELLAGAAGTMTGFAFPEVLSKVIRTFRAGDVAAAGALFYRYAPLIRFEFQEKIGTAIRKEILKRRGCIDNAAVRPPGGPLDATTMDGLDRVLAWSGFRGGAEWTWD